MKNKETASVILSKERKGVRGRKREGQRQRQREKNI